MALLDSRLEVRIAFLLKMRFEIQSNNILLKTKTCTYFFGCGTAVPSKTVFFFYAASYANDTVCYTAACNARTALVADALVPVRARSIESCNVPILRSQIAKLYAAFFYLKIVRTEMRTTLIGKGCACTCETIKLLCNLRVN